MKYLIKTVFGLSIAALLTVFISCPQPAGPGGGNNGTVTPVPKTPVEKALGELTVSPVQVYNGTDKVDLPITTSIAGVTITWTASPEGYINLESGTEWGKIKKTACRVRISGRCYLNRNGNKGRRNKNKRLYNDCSPCNSRSRCSSACFFIGVPVFGFAGFYFAKERRWLSYRHHSMGKRR